MFKLSKLTDYAVVVLVRLSRDDSVQTAPYIAAATSIPEPTVAKVLKTLAGRGLVVSRRCRNPRHRPLLTESGYKWGFETDIEMDIAPKGLTEDTFA
jgi:DNA-binding MarR family transcriptional regulator